MDCSKVLHTKGSAEGGRDVNYIRGSYCYSCGYCQGLLSLRSFLKGRWEPRRDPEDSDPGVPWARAEPGSVARRAAMGVSRESVTRLEKQEAFALQAGGQGTQLASLPHRPPPRPVPSLRGNRAPPLGRQRPRGTH